MSADNYIAVLHCKDGYRVAHCQALENLFYWPTGRMTGEYAFNHETGKEEELEEYEERSEINPQMLKEIFADCVVYINKEDADQKARQLEKSTGWVEYGICDIRYDKEFPK